MTFRGSRLLLGTLIAVTVALPAGCGSDSGTTATPAAVSHISGSRAERYTTLGQLESASDAVARVTAGSAVSSQVIAGLPTTIIEVKVPEELKGSLPETILVRQVGASDVVVEGFGDRPGSSLLTSGATYVLFLEGFTRQGEDTANQYVVVGAGAGMFLQDGEQLRRQDELSPELPEAIEADALREEVAG